MFNKIKRLSLSLLVFFLIGGGAASAQDIRAVATADTNKALIGDHIGISLKISAPKNTNIIFPAIADSIGRIEIISKSAIDTSEENGKWLLKQKYVITCFDTGYFEAPPFVFMYEQKGTQNLFPFETEPLYFYFATVNVDTALPIKDIKAPLDVPLTFEEILPYLLAGLGIAAVIAAGVYFFMKRKPKARFDLGYDPTVPPHIAAMQALKELENDKLWQKGLVKEYYIRLTEILRIFLERKFKINALEMTSDEIVDSCAKVHINNEDISILRKILTTADLAKFAKYVSLPEENILCMQYAGSFVGNTSQIVLNDEKSDSAVSNDSEKVNNENVSQAVISNDSAQNSEVKESKEAQN